MSAAIKLVCATRASFEQFYTQTALGRSLALFNVPSATIRVFPNNVAGLPQVYNTVLRESVGKPAILVFIHDDVHLLDFFWPELLVEGLKKFDIIGLAGNKRRAPRQAGWMFLDDKLTRDAAENLSGVVGHGKGWPAQGINRYGPTGVEVKIMDGLLLAAHSETLLSNGVAFDETFDFNFYDLDFCRSAEVHGLHMGTWPIQVIHESGGDFTTARWRQGYERYIDKWKS
jgi:hypothetical protein